MVYSRSTASALITVTSSESDWSYTQLTDIEILDGPDGHYARLICEHDCGGEMFTATCNKRDFRYLEPYAQLLESNRADPIGIEKPVIPVFFKPSGRAFLSVQGALIDFPELPQRRTKCYVQPKATPEWVRPTAKSRLAWLQDLFRG